MRVTNKFYRAFLIGSFVFGITNPLQAQTWQSLNGPLESDISNIVVQGDSIYATSMYMDSFFKKHKDSEQWMFVQVTASDGINEFPVTSLNTIEVSLDGTYYAGGIGGAVLTSSKTGSAGYFYVSDDFGKSWKPMDNGLGHCSGGIYPGVNSIIISDKGSLIVDCGYSIFKYSEKEESFKETSDNPTLSSNPVFSFYEYEDTLAAGRVSGFEYSTNDGNSWTASVFDSVEVFSFEYMDGTWFAGTNAGLYSSNSISGTFEQVDELSDVPVHALYRYQNHIIAGTDSGAYRINPDNLAVQAVFKGAYSGAIKSINSIEETILLGTGNGLFECATDTEDCALTGVPNSQIRTINFQGEDTLWVGSTNHVYRYFMETNKWDSSSVPISGSTLSGNIIPLNNNRFHSFGDSYFYTCSMENSQCDSTQVDSGNMIFDLKQNTAGHLFLASRKRVFKSTDNGNAWENIYTSPERQNYNLVPYSDSLLFINSDGIKYNLTDNTYDTIDKTVHIITQDGTIYTRNTEGIQTSSDWGETWKTLLRAEDMERDQLREILYHEDTENIYLISTQGRVYVSDDKGANWGVNADMYPTYIEDAAIGPNGSLYLGTGNAGVFINTKPLSPPITISNEEKSNSSISKNFKLHQNFPNPFNPSTTIPFELNQVAEVSISLFNIFGQKVREYNLGRRPVGSYQHQIELNQQASGVYFVRVKAGEQSQTIKISLIK